MSFSLTNLTCEYQTNPLGIDVNAPRLAWQLTATGGQRGLRQSAYRILVAGDEVDLANGRLVWDSGRQDSEQSNQVPYQGPALQSAQRVVWKVQVWDLAGDMQESEPAHWEMGLLQAADWQGQWIAAPFWGGPRSSSPAPYMRKEFSAANRLISARLTVTAVGLVECWLNGTRVGDALLTPGWTDYTQRIQYQVYDVSAQIRAGANAWGVILGDGWGVGYVGWAARQRYADRPQLLAQLVLTYADGSRETVMTDDSWVVTQGPILEADLMMGESYDARRELHGWSEPGFDSSRCWAVEVLPAPKGRLVATNGPCVKRQQELKPVSLNTIPDFINPRWIFDLGQNMVGWVRLQLQGPRGSTVTLRYAEALNPDGTLYTANLRAARNTDHYTLRGGGPETWEPRFLFHGFRYVELTGFPGQPDLQSVTGVVIHSEMAVTGDFECSDPQINQLQHNILWGQKGNFVDVPTDCPQRDERLGWTGDAQVFVRTAAFNLDVAGFFTKWTADLQDSQAADGAYPPVAPNPGIWPGGDGGPAWADAGVICPWTMYECYGDVRLLQERYASMQRFIEFLSATQQNGLRCYEGYDGWHGFGDWLALDGSNGVEGGTSKTLIGTAFFEHSTRLLGRIAAILGHGSDAGRYTTLADQVRQAFIARFVNADGSLVGDNQTGYVLALHFDLLPPELRTAAAAHLARNIRGRGMHLSTGFVGTPYISRVLSDNGYLDTAYALLKQESWPSWLYSITQGATTIWERWDGWTEEKGFQDPGMNSFNHYAYGAVGAWLYAVVAGIDLDPQQPGGKQLLMAPRPGGGLTYAKASLRTPYGLVRSEWSLQSGRFHWEVEVPANSHARLSLPCGDPALIREGGLSLTEANGLRVLDGAGVAVIVAIESGMYRFECPYE